ncbi:hypothetical protein [Georgenia sp. SYP-B2076]|uniref:hypothetical protein n=1 Tax=Georgenia sp. SYP-B2076 TaxID=2495881 RepID=UPI000F8E5E6C|nr:hypothetical protein [Georgenia sp. SYP-B2076]
MNARRRVAVLIATTALLALGGAPAASAHGGRSVETESEARPDEDRPIDRDVSERRVKLAGRHVRAEAEASAKVRCDDCAAEAVTFQIVSVHRAKVTKVRNEARATARCENCRAAAVSVQVVVARTRTIRPDNRAEAVNDHCTGCTTSAAAYQFVLVGDRKKDLSERGRALVAQIETEMVGVLAPAGVGAGPAPAGLAVQDALQAGADRIEAVLRDEMGNVEIERHVDVSG